MSELLISNSFGLSESPIELYKNTERKLAEVTGNPEASLECNLWLKAAAKEYLISPDIRDYVLVPCPILISDIPNTNGDSVTIQEFLRFDPEMGMQAFKTARGKPCQLEHANKDITKAKGVILDVFLRPLKRFGNGKYWKLVELMAYDRTKDPLLVQSILSGENNAYSIGFYYNSYTCSICGSLYTMGGSSVCKHTFPRKPTYEANGQLVYRQCRNIRIFETSSVATPAYVNAVGSHVMNLSTY
jgi:hypothetical protein